MGVATAAWAGQQVTYLVTVDTGTQEAYGAIGAAHNSADPIQFIGCATYTYASGFEFAYCSARDENGAFASCQSTDPRFLAVARGVNNASLVRFSWDASGNCTQMIVNNSSYYVPKVAPVAQ
jgi:hypothetical protein